MKTHVVFESENFPAVEGEDEQINPGRFGKKIAEFLAGKLGEAGLETEELIAEDWGWMVPVKNPDFKLWVGCGNYDEKPTEFLCFIEPHTPTVRKLFKKVDTTERVGAVQAAMDKALTSHPGIKNVNWTTHDEFNSP